MISRVCHHSLHISYFCCNSFKKISNELYLYNNFSLFIMHLLECLFTQNDENIYEREILYKITTILQMYHSPNHSTFALEFFKLHWEKNIGSSNCMDHLVHSQNVLIKFGRENRVRSWYGNTRETLSCVGRSAGRPSKPSWSTWIAFEWKFPIRWKAYEESVL